MNRNPILKRWLASGSIVVAILACQAAALSAVPPRIASGDNHVLGLKSDGTVIGWGESAQGQLAIPATLSNVIAIAGGDEHSLALTKDGQVTAWGNNYYHQCTIPASHSTGVIAICAFQSDSMALKSNGTVAVWGYGGQGQTNVPAGLTDVKLIGAGAEHVVALKKDGTLVYWGTNSNHQYDTPPGLTNVTALVCGLLHTVALQADGKVVAWGFNGSGQCDVPIDLADVVAIGAGHYHTLAVRSNGTVTAWGSNGHRQCEVPAGLSNVIAVAGGYRHSVALKSDGTVVAWGTNNYGQCDVPAGLRLLLKPGQLCLGAAAYTAAEGSKRSVTIKRIGGSDGTVSVKYLTKPKSALAGQDYAPKSGTLTWTNGDVSTKKVKINIVSDGQAEGNEKFLFVLQAPVEATLASPAKATITIQANTKGAPAESAIPLDGGSFKSIAWKETVVEGSGTLEFDWLLKGAAPETCVLLVDGQVQQVLAETYAWRHESVALGEGTHTVRWVFVGNSGVLQGGAFLEHVSWSD